MTNLKALMERREELRQNMETLVSTADTECRAMTEEEAAQFDAAENELRAIDATIEREERTRGVSNLPAPTAAEERAAAEESAFVDYVLGRAPELRAGEQNLTMANNGAIIPTSIADRIVTAVRDRCPILSGATIYRVNGTLKVPVWGKANTTHDIAVGYQTEFTELTADSGKFTSVDLNGYLAGALTLSIMILPLILRTTEEALMAVPDSYREGSFGLGAGKLRTVFRIVLPSAMPGVLAGVILAIGRIVGESAALIYTSGSGTGNLSFIKNGAFSLAAPLFQSTRTLSVHMYALMSEGLYTDQAHATAVILMVLVIGLNALSSFAAKKLTKQ